MTERDQDAAICTTAETPLKSIGEQVYNEFGVIAENYHDLQGLGVLAAARSKYPVPKASQASMIRAIFQAVEIALINLNDIYARAGNDIDSSRYDGAVTKLFWARGFHRLLVRLSTLPQQIMIRYSQAATSSILRIHDSPAYRSYGTELRRFDALVMKRIAAGDIELDRSIADESLSSAHFNLIHLVRISNHESTIWESNLTEVAVPAFVPSYSEFVVTDGMREAVYERVLKGDTYFTQFRGLHQIPEILGEEVNDGIEEAIRYLRGGHVPETIDRLGSAVLLTDAMLASLPPMVDNLATSDYHRIRENLGLTSGSHSVCLRYHMFTHLYEQLSDEVRAYILGRRTNDFSPAELGRALQRASDEWTGEPHAWNVQLLVEHCLRLQSFIAQWREEHLNLPRNNLGGEFTQSP